MLEKLTMATPPMLDNREQGEQSNKRTPWPAMMPCKPL